MLKRFTYILSTLVLASATLCSTSSQVNEMNASDPELKSSATINGLVKKNAMFDTLQAALEATGLNQMLEGPGPFTVLAPTDSVSI
jgi:uncharacterized surface protein with fasciclin (FAS1) repeats